jgi:hypothetical protein
MWFGMASLLILAVAGCSSASISSSPTAGASPAPSYSRAPAPTATGTPAPVGFTQQADGSITWYDGEGKERTVPEFRGIEPQLRSGKVIYNDARGEAAEFKPNLIVSGEQTGVFVARADIAARLIKSANTGDALEIPIFVDTRKIDNSQTVTVRFSPDNGLASLSRMVIDLPEAADLLVYSPFNTGETVAVEGLSIFSYYDPVRATDGAHALLSPLMKSVFIYGFGVSGGHVDVKKDFTLTATQRVGKKIATASAGEISASCASADNSVSTILRPAENLLTDNGVPIGIIEVAS